MAGCHGNVGWLALWAAETGGVKAIHACDCCKRGPYLLLLTGIWYMKICSCSRIDIDLRYKRTILAFIGLFTWQRKCSECVLTSCEVDNGHISSWASSQSTFDKMNDKCNMVKSHPPACVRHFLPFGI